MRLQSQMTSVTHKVQMYARFNQTLNTANSATKAANFSIAVFQMNPGTANRRLLLKKHKPKVRSFSAQTHTSRTVHLQNHGPPVTSNLAYASCKIPLRRHLIRQHISTKSTHPSNSTTTTKPSNTSNPAHTQFLQYLITHPRSLSISQKHTSSICTRFPHRIASPPTRRPTPPFRICPSHPSA